MILFCFLTFSGKAQSDFSSDTCYWIQILPTELVTVKEARLDDMLSNNGLPLAQYTLFSEALLSYFENNGYPFASVSLQNVTLNDTLFHATLHIDKNAFIVYDTIVIRGDVSISKHFFRGFCNFRKGKMYQEEKIAKVSSALKSLSFAQEVQPASIEFSDDKASLYLFLEERKVNQFDGYIGLVPTDDNTGKLAVSGELQLQLHNVLKQAESLSLHWRATERFSQYLDLEGRFPYLLGTPFGVEGRLLLDKKDTTYLNMNYDVGVNYSFLGMNYVKLLFDYSTSNILLQDSLALLMGNLGNSQRSLYGVEFLYEESDFKYNPRRGYTLYANVAMGNSQLSSFAAINELTHTTQARYRFIGKVNGYIPVAKRWVIALEGSAGTLIGNELLLNEVFQLGGMHSLQGFDDRSITASSYAFGKAELRLLIAKLTYLSAFCNGGWYERNLNKQYTSDFPLGFGVGMNFETKAGMFYLSYALGKVTNSPLSFRNGKIHFGLNLKF